MNNRFIKINTVIASAALFMSGCGESNNSSFQDPTTSDIPTNSGIVSQKNISLLAKDPQPKVFDPATGSVTDLSVEMTVKIGDNKNQLLTDKHTVFFATEWGLIDSQCITEDGKCTVTWQTSFGPNTVPPDHLVTIIAYTVGEESFTDLNGNGKFDDTETATDFVDGVEPFVDANRDGVFNTGDTLIDVINGNDLTGKNGAHDIGDTFLNSPNCTHSSLCSTVARTTFVWDDIQLDMDGPPAAP